MRISVWWLLFGAIVGIPLGLYALDVALGLVRAIFTRREGWAARDEFIAAWESLTHVPFGRIGHNEQVARNLFKAWTASRKQGDPRSAAEFLAEVARGAVKPAPHTPPPLTPEEDATADGQRLAGIKIADAPAMRSEVGDDAAAERAARVATSKAARAAAKAASSAAYLKTHGPSTPV